MYKIKGKGKNTRKITTIKITIIVILKVSPTIVNNGSITDNFDDKFVKDQGYCDKERS